ncbi:ATP synthase subunit b, sodium ion specific [Candidatus Brocadiaceae bacterium B188]|nr:F0F1 ATP synthase subunit B [Candidatus Brocadia sapporoensis]QQR67450.1 MAG: F0F1 ATP synthase subunit B [Candidatus Brocadia sp.]TWU52254.1 ATP synthase subunit b, sodium ion specific [Candidatus Brocadiaceae bacterium B188]
MDILNTLGINFKSIIIQGVGFLILLFVLKKFLFGKVSAIMKARTDEVKNTYEKTEKDRAEAERLMLEYQKKLTEAEAEAARKVQEAINEGNRISEEIVKRAKEEVEQIRLKAQESIEQERKRALSDIRNQVVTLSVLASSKIIQQSISQKTAEKLVDDFIEEIGELSVR